MVLVGYDIGCQTVMMSYMISSVIDDIRHQSDDVTRHHVDTN